MVRIGFIWLWYVPVMDSFDHSNETSKFHKWWVLWLGVFDSGPVHLRFVVDKAALREIFLPVLQFSSVSIILPLLHTHLHLHVAVTRRTNGHNLGTFQNATLFRKSGVKILSLSL
jgi:hypothetical protein